MKFNLNELNPGTFFFFDEDNPEEGGVEMRLATAGVIEEIEKKVTKKKIIWKRGQKFEDVTRDEKLYSDLLWDYVIVDWKGIIDDSTGEEIPCTKENKSVLMRGSVKFSAFIGDCIEQLTYDVGQSVEDQEKN